MKTNADTRTKTRTVAAIAALALAALIAVPGLAAADHASVVVSFSVSPFVKASVVDGGLTVHTNTAWTLTLETLDADGNVKAETISGPATGSEGVRVAADALLGYTLVAEATR